MTASEWMAERRARGAVSTGVGAARADIARPRRAALKEKKLTISGKYFLIVAWDE